MPTQDELDELTRRIAELERELAEVKSAHAALLEAEKKSDEARGAFNPG